MSDPARRLVLSCFSGVGALDEGFRRAGFCVVSAGDVAWGGFYDLGKFHPPRDVFEGVIGGDPCQAHSVLANLVRAKGLGPRFPDLTPVFERVICEANPRWFLRENVPGAPNIAPPGFAVASFLLDLATLDAGNGTGHPTGRRRRFWFGVRGASRAYELRARIDFALFVGDKSHAVTADSRAVPVRFSGGKTKGTWSAGKKSTIAEQLEAQGLPVDLLEHSPLTAQGKRALVGNAVPLPMAEALARAIVSVGV